MNYPNFRDFYQKALIPIGLNDQAAFTESEIHQSDSPPFSTHWLIALEGALASDQKEYYHWKVSIYPSNSHGAFEWYKSYYSSPMMDSFNNAVELARTFESYSKNDQLLTKNLKEKIS